MVANLPTGSSIPHETTRITPLQPAPPGGPITPVIQIGPSRSSPANGHLESSPMPVCGSRPRVVDPADPARFPGGGRPRPPSTPPVAPPPGPGFASPHRLWRHLGRDPFFPARPRVGDPATGSTRRTPSKDPCIEHSFALKRRASWGLSPQIHPQVPTDGHDHPAATTAPAADHRPTGRPQRPSATSRAPMATAEPETARQARERGLPRAFRPRLRARVRKGAREPPDDTGNR